MEKVKPKIKKDVYELTDGDYVLIKTLQELIKVLRNLR